MEIYVNPRSLQLLSLFSSRNFCKPSSLQLLHKKRNNFPRSFARNFLSLFKRRWYLQCNQKCGLRAEKNWTCENIWIKHEFVTKQPRSSALSLFQPLRPARKKSFLSFIILGSDLSYLDSRLFCHLNVGLFLFFFDVGLLHFFENLE